MTRKIVGLLCLAMALLSCDRQAFFHKLIPQEEVDFSKEYIKLIQEDNYDAIEEKLDPALKNNDTRENLHSIAIMLPKETPKSINVVGSNTISMSDIERFNLTFQYEFPNKWLLINVVLRKNKGALLVEGVHIQPLTESLEKTNEFTFENKPVMNYVVLFMAILIPIFILVVLVICIKTPIPNKKYLWILFILVGFCRIFLNWTTGGISIQPISVSLLGAGYFRAGPYAPYMITVSVPIGAIVFLLRRKKFLTQTEQRGLTTG